MKQSDNRKKVSLNISAGMIYQLATIMIGIAIPRIVLVNLGSEANGLINSTNQVITYLALLEGGMGLSITQSLYGPIAQNNYNDLNGIMSASNIFYKNVGKWYFIFLCAIAAIYSFTIKSSFTKLTIFLVVILTGMPQVINFFFQGKYRTLITVAGKGYVLTNLATVVYIAQSIIKILLLINGFDIVALQLMYCFSSLLQMIFIVYFVRKNFPWINIKVKPMTERIGQRKSVMIHQISGFIFSNTDMVVLTYFRGLKVVSVYSMYNMFFSMVGTMISNITGSVVFAMGQKFNSDIEEFKKWHNIHETVDLAITFTLNTVLMACIIPFLKIYTADITDINYIDRALPYLFSVIQLLLWGRYPVQKVIEYSGKFRETQWHSAVEMLLNISVSIVGSYYFGIYGVLFGTIVSLSVRTVLMTNYANQILKISSLITLKKWIMNIIAYISMLFVADQIKWGSTSVITIIIRACIFLIAGAIIYTFFISVYDVNTFQIIKNVVRKNLRLRINRMESK